MTSSAPKRNVQIEAEGRVVAEAELEQLEAAGAVRAVVHVEPGHLPAGTRSRLVTDVFESPEVKGAERFTGVLPRGDAEMLDGVRERLTDCVTREAGASVIVEADTPNGQP